MSSVQAPLLEAVEDVSRGNRKIPQSEFLAEGGLAVVDQGKSLVAGYTDELDAAVNFDGPLIVFGDHTRTFKYVDFPFAMGADGVKVLRAREGFDPKFVYHYLTSREIPSAGYSRHFKFLKQVEVPKPKLSEQRRVAAVLDHADAVRGKRRQVLAHLDSLADSLFSEMFGTGELWPIVPIGQLGDVTTGKTPPTRSAGMFGGHIPFVTPVDLGSRRPVVRTVSEAGAAASRVVRAGSTLVCCIGATIGKSDVVREPSAFNQQINAVEWGHQIDDAYGLAAMRSVKPVIVARGSSTTLPLLPKGQFAKLEMRVPPMELQVAFAERVAAIASQRVPITAAVEWNDELFASLQARAFNGEL